MTPTVMLHRRVGCKVNTFTMIFSSYNADVAVRLNRKMSFCKYLTTVTYFKVDCKSVIVVTVNWCTKIQATCSKNIFVEE